MKIVPCTYSQTSIVSFVLNPKVGFSVSHNFSISLLPTSVFNSVKFISSTIEIVCLLYNVLCLSCLEFNFIIYYILILMIIYSNSSLYSIVYHYLSLNVLSTLNSFNLNILSFILYSIQSSSLSLTLAHLETQGYFVQNIIYKYFIKSILNILLD